MEDLLARLKHLDREAVSHLLKVGAGAVLLPKIHAIYVASGADFLDQLLAAREAKDPSRSASAAHAFKSSSLNLGARGPAEISAKIEGETVSDAAWPEVFESLKHEISKAERELYQLSRSLTAKE